MNDLTAPAFAFAMGVPCFLLILLATTWIIDAFKPWLVVMSGYFPLIRTHLSEVLFVVSLDTADVLVIIDALPQMECSREACNKGSTFKFTVLLFFAIIGSATFGWHVLRFIERASLGRKVDRVKELVAMQLLGSLWGMDSDRIELLGITAAFDDGLARGLFDQTTSTESSSHVPSNDRMGDNANNMGTMNDTTHLVLEHSELNGYTALQHDEHTPQGSPVSNPRGPALDFTHYKQS